MYQPPRGNSSAPTPAHPDPSTIRVLVYAGRADTTDRVELVILAASKASRLGQCHPGLILMDGSPCLSRLGEAGIASCVYPGGTLGKVLNRVDASGKLLLPCHHQRFGDVFLHAMASGLSMDAINFRHPTGAEIDSMAGCHSVFMEVDRLAAVPRDTHLQ